MSQEYEQSEYLELLAKRIIESNHQHLKCAQISYLMKEVDKDAPQRIETPGRAGKHKKIATARLVPDIYHELSGFDFVIVVDQKYWDRLGLEQQEAVMDHELCHCRYDEKGFYLADHDVEDFRVIIERHGFYRVGLEEFCTAHQMTLPMESNNETHVVH